VFPTLSDSFLPTSRLGSQGNTVIASKAALKGALPRGLEGLSGFPSKSPRPGGRSCLRSTTKHLLESHNLPEMSDEATDHSVRHRTWQSKGRRHFPLLWSVVRGHYRSGTSGELRLGSRACW